MPIDWWLAQWGLWARSGHGMRLAHPSVTPFAKMQPRAAQGLVVTDAEALLLDRLVSALRLQYPDEHDALARRYVAGQTYPEIARQRGWRNQKRAAAVVKNGERFVEGAFILACGDP